MKASGFSRESLKSWIHHCLSKNLMAVNITFVEIAWLNQCGGLPNNRPTLLWKSGLCVISIEFVFSLIKQWATLVINSNCCGLFCVHMSNDITCQTPPPLSDTHTQYLVEQISHHEVRHILSIQQVIYTQKDTHTHTRTNGLRSDSGHRVTQHKS